jgi:hypothetical protein
MNSENIVDYPIIHSAVMEMIELISEKTNLRPKINLQKADYNFYGDHKTIRPYKDILEGVNWYLNQPEIEHIPEELIINIVAHNFGMTMEQAVDEINKSVLIKDGIVDFS